MDIDEKRFAEMFWRSREAKCKSQEYMSHELHVSCKTIRNWESGRSCPTFFQAAEWFRVLGMNPFRFFLTYLYPEYMETLTPSSEDKFIENAIIGLMKERTIEEKRQMLYVLAGPHGSSWYPLLQMFTAHCHTSMQSRVAAAQLILSNYEIEAAADVLVCPDNVQPNIDMLRKAVEQGKMAALKQQSGYTAIE